MVDMAQHDVDEQLAMLCHMQLAGGDEIPDLPRPELERLLSVAVVSLMDAKGEAEREVSRMARRLQQRRSQD